MPWVAVPERGGRGGRPGSVPGGQERGGRESRAPQLCTMAGVYERVMPEVGPRVTQVSSEINYDSGPKARDLTCMRPVKPHADVRP